MIAQTPFYYVRHGQTDWNLTRKLQGNSDIPLNETGVEQAYRAKQVLGNINIATICTSPLQRAVTTAQIINEDKNCPIIEIDGLRECDFGPHEGTQSYDWLSDWLDGNTTTTPCEVEPWDAFLARTRAAINMAVANPGPVLIVAHGGVFAPIKQVIAPENRGHLQNGVPVHLQPPAYGTGQWQYSAL